MPILPIMIYGILVLVQYKIKGIVNLYYTAFVILFAEKKLYKKDYDATR